MKRWFQQEKLEFKLWLGGLSVLFLIGFIWVGSRVNFFERVFGTQDIRTIANRIEILALESRGTESDFMLNDLADPKFYQTGESINLTKHKTILANLRQQIVALSNLLPERNKQTALDLLRLSDQYVENFFKLVAAYRERGDKEALLDATWAKVVDDLENGMRDINNYPLFKQLLTLQRDERGYIIGRQETDIDLVAADIEKLKKLIPDYAGTQTQRALDDVGDYEAAFKNHVIVNRKIGLSEDMGLQSDIRYAIRDILPLIQKIQEQASLENTAASKELHIAFYLSIMAGLGLIGLIGYIVYKRKTVPTADADLKREPLAASRGDLAFNERENVATLDHSTILAMNAAIEATHKAETAAAC